MAGQGMDAAPAPTIDLPVVGGWSATESMLKPDSIAIITAVHRMRAPALSADFTLDPFTLREVILRPHGGRIGLGLRPPSDCNPFCTVVRFEQVSGIPGVAETSGQVFLGDQLLSVERECVGGLPLNTVVAMIKRRVATCVLGVCRPTAMRRPIISVTLEFNPATQTPGVHFSKLLIRSAMHPARFLRCLMVVGVVQHPSLADRQAREMIRPGSVLVGINGVSIIDQPHRLNDMLQHNPGFQLVTLHLIDQPFTCSDVEDMIMPRQVEAAPQSAPPAPPPARLPRAASAGTGGKHGGLAAIAQVLNRAIKVVAKQHSETHIASGRYPFSHPPSPFCRRVDAPLGTLCTEINSTATVIECVQCAQWFHLACVGRAPRVAFRCSVCLQDRFRATAANSRSSAYDMFRVAVLVELRQMHAWNQSLAVPARIRLPEELQEAAHAQASALVDLVKEAKLPRLPQEALRGAMQLCVGHQCLMKLSNPELVQHVNWLWLQLGDEQLPWIELANNRYDLPDNLGDTPSRPQHAALPPSRLHQQVMRHWLRGLCAWKCAHCTAKGSKRCDHAVTQLVLDEISASQLPPACDLARVKASVCSAPGCQGRTRDQSRYCSNACGLRVARLRLLAAVSSAPREPHEPLLPVPAPYRLTPSIECMKAVVMSRALFQQQASVQRLLLLAESMRSQAAPAAQGKRPAEDALPGRPHKRQRRQSEGEAGSGDAQARGSMITCRVCGSAVAPPNFQRHTSSCTGRAAVSEAEEHEVPRGQCGCPTRPVRFMVAPSSAVGLCKQDAGCCEVHAGWQRVLADQMANKVQFVSKLRQKFTKEEWELAQVQFIKRATHRHMLAREGAQQGTGAPAVSPTTQRARPRKQHKPSRAFTLVPDLPAA